jgi:DNA-directed RNA polymerase subunit alpha
MPLTTDIHFPEKPEVVSESDQKGRYRIDGLYPGYGYTLGNSLRRIILSSLPGAAITSVQIDGVSHEFTTIDGVKEDVITMLMNLKNVRFSVSTDETQSATLSAEGTGEVTAGDIDTPGQMNVENTDQRIATITDDSTELEMQLTIETGLGYVTKENVKEDKLSAGEMALDADFSPIRRVNYEVEDMRVGDRTDFNRLEMIIETDGTISPRNALEDSIEIMIRQLQSVIELADEPVDGPQLDVHGQKQSSGEDDGSEQLDDESLQTTGEEDIAEFRKTRAEKLDLPTRTKNALERASIRTVGGLMQKTRSDLLDVDGLGAKGVDEIEAVLENNGVSLKES